MATLRPHVMARTIDRLRPHGNEYTSLGGQYSFRIIVPCCRLFDREELPWPCCRIQWRSKEPSWRRIGQRLVPDIACRRSPSYAVELLHPDLRPTTTVLSLFAERLSPDLQAWWYSKTIHCRKLATTPEPPLPARDGLKEPESAAAGGTQK